MTSKVTFFSLSAILVSCLTSMAFASNIACSNAAGTVKYDARLDTGGNPENDINWMIDGNRFMQESSLEIVAPPGSGGPGFSRPTPEVTSEFKKESILDEQLDKSNIYVVYKATHYTSFAKVTSIATAQTIFEGYLICVSRESVRTPRS